MAFPSFNGIEGSDMVELDDLKPDLELQIFCRIGMMSDAKTMKDANLTENANFRKAKKGRRAMNHYGSRGLRLWPRFDNCCLCFAALLDKAAWNSLGSHHISLACDMVCMCPA
jgi:hypothetical protein